MEFWNQITRYGLFHQAGKEAKRYRGDVLVVFVHGIFGNPEDTWSETPQWLSERLGSNVNILSFSYAAGLWQKASIPQASSDLKTCLDTAYSNYNFVIFITHSTGGLVVKHLLNESYREIQQQIDNNTFSYEKSPSIWLKTRRVVNIAVPHFGGDPSLTKIGQSTYNYVYWLAKPFLKLIRLLTQGAADVGKNTIIDALRHGNPWLTELHEGSEQAIADSRQRLLPHPTSFDILAGSDIAVPTLSTTGKQLTFRGNHDTVKIPDHKSGPIMDILVSQVAGFSGDNYYLVTHASAIARKLDSLNRELGIFKLIGQHADSNDSKGSQQAVFDKLYAQLNKNNGNFPHQLLLTGSGGSGKSTVMRELLSQLSFDYLMDPGPQQVIPFSMPLQMMPGSEVNAELDWNRLWAWHENWVNELFPSSTFRSQKIVPLFDTQAVCIMFDGLDEFLALHNDVSSAHILNIFKQATKRYRHNPKFSILTVCRSSLPGVEHFADSQNTYDVARLSMDDARMAFPICGTWLDYVEDKNLLDVVLTPLILSSLDDMPGINGQALNATHIIGQSIDSILRKSSLEGSRLPDGTPIHREHLLIALMLVAWVFFRKALGEISLKQLNIEVQSIANEWSAFLQNNDLQDENEQLKASLSLLNSEYFITGLVQRTLFITTGKNKIRFSNRQWHDYLIALYFKQCLTLGHVDDFGDTAFNPVIYRMAGELMHDEVITERMAQRAISRWQETGNSSIVGDILAFISWTTVAIEPSAVRLFLSEAGNYKEITRIVLLAGFGYRGLENADGDRSSKDIRQALLPMLRVMADCNMCPIGDRVASSLAWCYLSAYTEKFNLEKITLPWPELRFNNDGQKIALSSVCKEVNGQYQLNKYNKSLQIAFLSAVKQAQNNPSLLIRSMHYLYFLVIAKKFGAHVIELNDGLDELLSNDSKFTLLINSENTPPELKLLFEHLQALGQES
ncbi:MAG TPA: hypothetical protein EYG50_02965 [Cycloclasticus sp.]|jgi:hypothetical protein|nr:hypothetical protein [Cycloclasticus sp.]